MTYICSRPRAAVAALLCAAATLRADPPPAFDSLTEHSAAFWGADAYNAGASVADDTTRVMHGQASIRFDTDGGFDTWLWAPDGRDASWDLLASGAGGLAFHVYVENDFTFQNGSPWIRLRGNGGDFIELRSTHEALNQAVGAWIELEIPIAGSSGWVRTTQGSPDLAAVRGVELHADTWGSGFTVWWDGFRFDPPVCPADFNADGGIDTQDVLAYLNAWSGRHDRADINGDGLVNTPDIIAFLNAWTGGC